VDPLLGLLDDPAATEDSVRALGRIGDARAVAPMREALASRRSEPAESDVRKRLRDLDCRRIKDAIDTLTGTRDG
jgi:HEAT repeat protein